MKKILFTLFVMGLILSHVGVSYSEDEKELKDLQGWLSKLGKNYSLKELKNSRWLNLSRHRLHTLPESIGQLKNLRKLDLSHNQLKTLPKSIGQLKNLRKLDLSNNGLKTLPKSIGQLKNLRKLDLSNNGLKTLPKSIGQLRNLKTLVLMNNRLKTLPESIGQLKNLKRLDLRNNRLKTLPVSIGDLDNLKTLDLSYNRLKTLPESISDLDNLKTLDLSYNRFKTLPEFIGKLKNLIDLNLTSNKLETLPESIGLLKSIVWLYLSNNRLKTLPKSISQLKNLRTLRLSNNQLKTFPKTTWQRARARAKGETRTSRKWGKSSGILKKNMIAPSYRFLSLPNQSDRHYFGVSYEFRLFKNLNPNKSDTFGYLFGSISFSTDRYMRVPLFGALTYPIAFIPLIVISFLSDQTMDDAILRHLAYLMAEGWGLRIYTASWLYISPFMGLSLDIPLKEDDYLMGLEAGLRFDFLPSKDFSISPYSSAYFELLKGDVGFSAGLNVGFYF